MEVDTAFFTDPDGAKADVVDVNLGEFSEFHNEFGYYPQGVRVSTGVFPAGWRDRLVAFEAPGTKPGRGGMQLKVGHDSPRQSAYAPDRLRPLPR